MKRPCNLTVIAPAVAPGFGMCPGTALAASQAARNGDLVARSAVRKAVAVAKSVKRVTDVDASALQAEG